MTSYINPKKKTSNEEKNIKKIRKHRGTRRNMTGIFKNYLINSTKQRSSSKSDRNLYGYGKN
jgi:hypothetical protein